MTSRHAYRHYIQCCTFYCYELCTTIDIYIIYVYIIAFMSKNSYTQRQYRKGGILMEMLLNKVNKVFEHFLLLLYYFSFRENFKFVFEFLLKA